MPNVASIGSRAGQPVKRPTARTRSAAPPRSVAGGIGRGGSVARAPGDSVCAPQEQDPFRSRRRHVPLRRRHVGVLPLFGYEPFETRLVGSRRHLEHGDPLRICVAPYVASTVPSASSTCSSRTSPPSRLRRSSRRRRGSTERGRCRSRPPPTGSAPPERRAIGARGRARPRSGARARTPSHPGPNA